MISTPNGTIKFWLCEECEREFHGGFKVLGVFYCPMCYAKSIDLRGKPWATGQVQICWGSPYAHTCGIGGPQPMWPGPGVPINGQRIVNPFSANSPMEPNMDNIVDNLAQGIDGLDELAARLQKDPQLTRKRMLEQIANDIKMRFYPLKQVPLEELKKMHDEFINLCVPAHANNETELLNLYENAINELKKFIDAHEGTSDTGTPKEVLHNHEDLDKCTCETCTSQDDKSIDPGNVFGASAT